MESSLLDPNTYSPSTIIATLRCSCVTLARGQSKRRSSPLLLRYSSPRTIQTPLLSLCPLSYKAQPFHGHTCYLRSTLSLSPPSLLSHGLIPGNRFFFRELPRKTALLFTYIASRTAFAMDVSKLLLQLLLLLMWRAAGEPTRDRAALRAFLAQTPHEGRVNWTASVSACDWVGVTCDPNRTAVVALRLPATGLVGPIPRGTLGNLSSLRVLSLRSNSLSGSIPKDLSNLSLLRSLYLQNNLLSGDFPTGLTRLSRLTRLDLSGNNLTGEIPFALSNLIRLSRLYLQRNHFVGRLPSIDLASLIDFNVSYNALNGSIPTPLERFPASSFVGNLDLCGRPLQSCTPFFPSPSPSPAAVQNPVGKTSSKLSTAAIIAISAAVGAGLLLAVLLLLICLAFRRRRRDRAPKRATAGATPRSGETGVTASSSSKEIGGGVRAEERNRLVFVGKNGGYSFDLEDLLRASAEVLGKGSMGTSYKAVLEEGTTVVVKRLKDVAVGKREFDTHMEILGRPELTHPNILPLRAYYYSKDEKLLVFDYIPAGSLSALLHGEQHPYTILSFVSS